MSDLKVVKNDGAIVVSIRPRVGDTVKGWEESREDLGLNKAGDAVEGVELVSEIGEFRDPADEYPHGYSKVKLQFDDFEALGRAKSHLYDKATERFEWGADGQVVQDFAGRLPTEYEAKTQIGVEQ